MSKFLDEQYWRSITLEVLQNDIENGFDINMRNKLNVTPFMLACKYNKNLDVIQYLVDKVEDINAKDHKGFTALFYLQKHEDDPEPYKVLLDAGADPNVKLPVSKDTVLTLEAAKGVDSKVIQCLIDNGANINHLDASGKNALSNSLIYNDVLSITKCLIRNGIDINNKDEYGDSPIRHAILHNNINFVLLLIDQGADLTVVNNKGKSLLPKIKKKFPNPDLIQLFKNCGA